MEVSTSAARNELLQFTAAAEGHPDNVAPCIYGGFQLCYKPTSLDDTMAVGSNCNADAGGTWATA